MIDENEIVFTDKAVGIHMTPRPTDEGLCVPQYLGGPSFATEDYRADVNPTVRKQLYDALDADTAAHPNNGFHNNSLKKITGASDNVTNIADYINNVLPCYSSGEPTLYSEGVNGALQNPAMLRYVQSMYGCAGTPTLYKSPRLFSGPHTWNSGELVYKGKLLPYTYHNGFVANALIPSVDHPQGCVANINKYTNWQGYITESGTRHLNRVYLINLFKQNIDSTELGVDRMVQVGAMTLHDTHYRGVLKTLDAGYQAFVADGDYPFPNTTGTLVCAIELLDGRDFYNYYAVETSGVGRARLNGESIYAVGSYRPINGGLPDGTQAYIHHTVISKGNRNECFGKNPF